MQTSAFYQQENSADFFSQLGAVVSDRDNDRRNGYRMMAKLFNRLINNATAESSILLSGPFAKTDFLLRKFSADKALRLAVNDARSRFAKLSLLDAAEMRRFFYYDFEALARFVALVFDCDTPAEIKLVFPQSRPPRRSGRITNEYLRVIVCDIHHDCIRGSSPDAPENLLEIRFACHDEDSDSPDFSYLRPMLRPGSQLNIIRPRRDEAGVLNPELIIYEPDLLTDVSAIASCFETYTTSPLINIIKRLSPAPTGDAINLGNFAGQLLDEIIHNECDSYADSAMRFFRNNALQLAATPPGRDFHHEARRQIGNIREAVLTSMRREVSSFDCSRLMVEPTFFSEMLGLQGRMDFLQLDMKILAEQKSGKGAFPYNGFEIPRHREPHYVQLLLYMAIIRYNFAERYRENNDELHAFLMYSKYSRSLLRLGFAPKLLREAMKVRNGIVFNDMRFADEGFGLLATISADDLCTNGRESTLWTRYSRPALCAILDPIRNASRLEREYFMRLMRFTAREHILSKIGNKQKEGSGFASTWHDSLEEKLDAGNIYTGLVLDYNFPKKGKIESLRLTFTDDEACDMANFRRGDIVILYPYSAGEVPDARRNMVFRCTIEDIAAGDISLRLRAPQSGPAPFEAGRGCLWAIEHDFIESSYSSLYRGMHSFLKATVARRDLLLLRRRPEVSTDVQLNGDYGPFNDLAMRVAAARDLYLIIGPPGTGKTSYGMLTTVQEELTRPDSNVLLLAYTNRAVDEICTKLLESGIEFIRLGSTLGCAEAARPCLLQNKVGECANSARLISEIKRHRVFVATTTAMNANSALFLLKQFSLGVIDEASQILEPQLLGILSATVNGHDCIRKFVLIGDHKQLPAIVQQTAAESAVTEECLHEIGLTDCRQSLFERLVRRYRHDPDVCRMLNRQGRMHHDIADFAASNFYNGLLTEVPLPHQTASLPRCENMSPGCLIASHRMLFFDVQPDAATTVADKVNHAEARLIALLLKEIIAREGNTFDPDDTVGVIVPYRNQIAAIRGELAALGIDNAAGLNIDTVERYQGSQRKYIIYGFTIRKYYQLQFLTSHVFEEDGVIIDRKLNVALTRAREHMIITGNAALLRRNLTFARLIDHITACDGYIADSNRFIK